MMVLTMDTSSWRRKEQQYKAKEITVTAQREIVVVIKEYSTLLWLVGK